ncbi:DUF2764 family protein [Desulfohalovibrio reitneri]|uniref:DUF2764 family protein n=1 Tax=Desulfohalovibrio reitneri TaxID=1307759 RepID=UPI0004A6F62F|nr:DUF2764 family protein [Desulfohalovibrio reitneri]
MALYYLAASLPHLVFGQPPPFGLGTFRFRLGGQLTESQERDLSLVLRGEPGGGDPFVDEWFDAREQVLDAVSRARVRRACALDEDCPQLARGSSSLVARRAEAAFDQDTPLRAEEELDRLRWRLLDEMTVNRDFEFRAVLAFAAKLSILLRWHALDGQRGRETVEAVIDAAAEEVRISP